MSPSSRPGNPLDHSTTDASTTAGLPVSPELGPALDALSTPRQAAVVDLRAAGIGGVAILVGLAAGVLARVLTALIGLITSAAFYGRVSTALVSPADHTLGPWVIAVPVAGGLIVGLMARFGSAAIRGHGIPEAMEQVLFNQSRMAPRLVLLKPISAAIAIGTGGPFGAEGPIIATGGAMGSVVGQLLTITAQERKTLLAAGAAAGMAATFGTPVSAVLLAIELLLFEYRARSVVPVALASVAATAVRLAFVGDAPVFAMPDIGPLGGWSIVAYVVLGGLVGVLSTWVTRAIYAVEDAFERLPVHWMWWPAIGGLAVGLVALVDPRTLGVGYENIEAVLDGRLLGTAAIALAALKFLSWSIALGSGTSGGTLAPLLTMGGAFGAGAGTLATRMVPHLGVDPRVAALVGMGAMFAGASRALLASVVFAFETTRQPMGLLPLLAGCTTAYFVSSLMMRHSIMTEKIARRGTPVSAEYAVDYLDTLRVRDRAARDAVTLRADRRLDEVRAWLASGGTGRHHQGFPVLDADDRLVGVVTRRDLLDDRPAGDRRIRELIRRPPAVVFDDSSLRDAADHMVRENVGRLPVVTRDAPRTVRGIITRSDLLAAHQRRLQEQHETGRALTIGRSVDRSMD